MLIIYNRNVEELMVFLVSFYIILNIVYFIIGYIVYILFVLVNL